MALNNAYTSANSQPQMENTVFDPWMIESVDVKPGETGLTMCLLKNIHM